MPDSFNIAWLQADPQAAFRALVARYGKMVYNTALHIVQDAHEAEDVAQEVFVQVFQSVAGFRGDSRLSTWMYRITVTKSLDHLKAKRRKKRWKLDWQSAVEPSWFHPGVEQDQQEKAALVYQAMDRLPDQQKAAFILYQLEELSYQEIALILETSVSAVESLLFRARQNLRHQLSKKYEAFFSR